MSSPIGTRAGPYQLVAEATMPGPGVWYRARRTRHQRRSADAWVRLLDDVELPAARRGYDALTRLTSAHWPRPLGFFDGAGAIAVAAPVSVPLSRLLTLRARGDAPLSTATVVDLALELVDALVHAHDRGLHHGALWPDVIGLSPQGAVTVWGIGEGLATPPRWTPPEVARVRPADALTDQWSVAAVVAGLVTAAPPWTSFAAARDNATCLAAAEVGVQWPALGRVLDRMLAVRPQNRYPTLHAARRDLLALARRCDAPSERRALGLLLSEPASPAPQASPTMPKPPRIQLPLPSTPTPATDIDEAATARPAAARARLPNESVPVVRPEVGSYGPTPVAKVAPAPAAARPIAGVRDDLDDVAVVDVEIDDTDQGLPVPIDVTPATDDMPYPSPDDVFGGIDILGGDPEDAPPVAAATPVFVTPSAARPGGGAVTAVPGTDPGLGSLDPGFDPISLDDPDPADDFFSQARFTAAQADQPGLDVDERDWEPREKSRVEQVAQGLVIANACLAALWMVVRIF